MVLGKVKDKILRRGKRDPEYSKALGLAYTQGQGQKPLSEQEWREQLGINYELLHDEFIEAMLQARCYKPGRIVKIKDDGGNEREIIVPELDRDMAALRTLMSHLNRTSFITSEEGELIKLYMERTIIGIEMKMDEDDYDLGEGNLLDAINVLIRLAVDDAVEGRKAKLIKTIPRRTEITVNPEQRKKGGWV